MGRFFFLSIVLLTLSGCLIASGPGLFVASVASFVNTKKTGADHVLSWATGQNCSTLAYSKGEDYCQPKEGAGLDYANIGPGGASDENAAAGAYCYRTIGTVTCYTNPDPSASAQALLP